MHDPANASGPADATRATDPADPAGAGDTGDRERAARLFDIRRIIGGLFLLYGVILTVVGLLDGAAAVQKAEGVRINLWTGVAMIVVGAVFLAWERLRPVDAPGAPAEDTTTLDTEETARHA
ncbi:hypothetical protein Sme01_02420 [Sphaerisporangium melleum]|uniref:Uncharacterized protein n=1 Tax=Sphaerisporangium melleum TaxID=321316 RepID=A0A917RR12_9ACTN|nr:hypothetical protein [Sphaerisporangium melleum]GGL21333.1 hypothetical protein GCM10007964_74090 [Sphaerisporangium melleum]GII67766.1 hypothetical protein Sme01_02420 [Sphaerisporangium melleum]